MLTTDSRAPSEFVFLAVRLALATLCLKQLKSTNLKISVSLQHRVELENALAQDHKGEEGKIAQDHKGEEGKSDQSNGHDHKNDATVAYKG